MKLFEDWRILLLVICVVLSLLLISTKGLSYGIDFIGGTEMKVEIEAGGEPYVDSVVEILKNRLNGLGLKSTQVLKEADGRHIVIKVSSIDPQDIAKIKDIINQQAVFEQVVEGNLCAKGTEIQLDITQQGGAFISGNNWQVYVKTSGDAPARCGQVMEGKAGHMTDIFLDRPSKSFILIDSNSCSEMSSTAFTNHPDDTGYTDLSFLEDRALIPIVCYNAATEPEGTNQSLLEELGVVVNETVNTTSLDLDEAISSMERLKADGKNSVIFSINETQLPQDLHDVITRLNLTVKTYPKNPDKPYHSADDPDSWIDAVTGLKSTLKISEGLTNGNPIYSSVFEGSSATTAEARETAQRFKIWMTSGNLPVKTQIVLERPNLPELGQQFFKYIGIMAVIALSLVAAIISIRYRRPKISIFILLTSFSEIVIVMGFASLMSWELDMAAFAGIIAAIGTGVDHQVVITDEATHGGKNKEARGSKGTNIWDIKDSFNRAFFIIITSVLTVIFAMLPLMSVTDLRGFAFTTIIGAGIGLMITRPAYARILEKIL